MERRSNYKTCCLCGSNLTTGSKNILNHTTSYSKIYFYKIIEEFLHYPIYKMENVTIFACSECCRKINEYDLSSITFQRHQEEIANIIQLAESQFQCLMGEYKIDIEETNLDTSYSENDPFSHNNTSNQENTEKLLLQSENTKVKDYESTNEDCSDEVNSSLGVIYFNDKTIEVMNSNSNSFIGMSTSTNFGKTGNTTQYQLKIHERRSFQCEYCMKFFLTKRGLKDHVIRFHTKQKPHRCTVCEEYFPTNYLLNYHRRRYHPDRSIQQCPVCSKRLETSFLTVDEHISHVHEGNPVECKECGMKFKQLTSLFRHRKLIHLNPRLYQCELCGKKFNENNALQKHIMFSHEKIKNFFCDQCNFKTITKAVLERHKRIHTGEKNYNCEICGKKYVAKYNLERHIKTLHYRIKEIN